MAVEVKEVVAVDEDELVAEAVAETLVEILGAALADGTAEKLKRLLCVVVTEAAQETVPEVETVTDEL